SMLGIEMSGSGENVIEHNTFTAMTGGISGIVGVTAKWNIHSNTFVANKGGLGCDSSSPLIDAQGNNWIQNNPYDIFAGWYGCDINARDGYWDTSDLGELEERIYHKNDDYNCGLVSYLPLATEPISTAPAFLVSATVSPSGIVQRGPMTVTLRFSHSMMTEVQPQVTFGVRDPFTQNRIQDGTWISDLEWQAMFTVTSYTGDGINTLRVSGALDDDGMLAPESEPLSFTISAAGESALILSATPGNAEVDLRWVEAQLDTLAGYNLYRGTSHTEPYTATPIASALTTIVYTDTAVTNGRTYYYRVSVLDTDLRELWFSDEIAVMPDDFTLPETPTVTDDGASTHYFDRLHATWFSADPDTGIFEYQYCIGTTVGGCDVVSWTSSGLGTEATHSGLHLSHGRTYYVNVKALNGANHWSMVGSSNGIVVDRLAAPSLTAVTPSSSVRSVARTITLTGSAFQASPLPAVHLGQMLLGDVAVLDATRLTALVPAGCAAGVYTVTVTNFDTQSASLSSAYTATNPIYPPAPVSPSTRAHVGLDEASLTVDVTVDGVNDLRGFEFNLVFDPAILQATSISLGPLLGSTGLSTFVAGQTLDNVTGRVRFGAGAYGAASSPAGSGVLATVTFAPAGLGASSLALQNVVLADSLSMPMAATEGSAQVRVITYPEGDLDRSCLVDVYDIMLVANRWNT
ncbi:MAG: hypothetical protein FJ276_35080, partial [Planctomycetes bacterium]|nr:hypothetical protein [Planctomycetota bacterium]